MFKVGDVVQVRPDAHKIRASGHDEIIKDYKEVWQLDMTKRYKSQLKKMKNAAGQVGVVVEHVQDQDEPTRITRYYRVKIDGVIINFHDTEIVIVPKLRTVDAGWEQ